MLIGYTSVPWAIRQSHGPHVMAHGHGSRAGTGPNSPGQWSGHGYFGAGARAHDVWPMGHALWPYVGCHFMEG